MESMPKIKKKNIPKSVGEMSKEMLQETLKKKKECNVRALNTVKKLCEEQVDEKWFLENLRFINQCHFDDVTIERAISKICGYPLCNQELVKVPAQQYHISTRYNKVFDITERKNFCSSNCYKSAMHVKKQLFTSPLWFRDQEMIPKYTVLKPSKFSIREVFLSDKTKPEVEDIKTIAFTDEAFKLNKNIFEIENKCSDLRIQDFVVEFQNEIETNIFNDVSTRKENNKININEKTDIVKEENNENNEHRQKGEKAMSLTPTQNTFYSTQENLLNKMSAEKKKPKKKNEPVNVIKKIERCIFEWFSQDTIVYLYGEEKLKELLQDKAIEVKEVLNSKLKVLNDHEKIDRIIQHYGLLDTDSFNSSDIKTKLKPLPSYSALKEEGRNFEIKVRAFYQGQLVIKAAKKEEKEEEENDETDSNPFYMPLIDSHAQIALRRKIVLDKLNRVLPELIKVFSSDYALKMNEVRKLVTTFTLTSNNIIFKPSEWYLIGIIIIKLLCLIDKQLESIMNLESSKNQTLVILMSYKLQKDYLDNLLLSLSDSTNLMKKLKDINR